MLYTCLYKCHLFEEKSNRHPATRKDVSWLGLCLQGMVPFGEFTAILASHFMAITARKKSRSHQRGAKNWVKGGYHGGIQLIWGNCEWADAPGMRGQEGTGRCYTRRTVRWATGILARNGKADMASSKLRYWSWFPCVYVHPESYFLHRGIHEIKFFFLYIYICYMYPKYTFVCHSRDKPLSTVLLEITYVRNKQNSTSWGKRNRWLVHGNCKFRQGGGFPWARKCGHGCLLVNDTTVIREIRFEDMIWYVFGLVPRTTSHWKIVGNESRAKGSMNICQWGRVKGKCGTLYCSCTVVFCMPMIWYNCDCLILEHCFVSFGHDVGWSYFVLFRIIIFNQLTGWVQSYRFSWCIFCSGLHLWHSTTFDGVTKWRVAEGQQEANANRWLDFRDCSDGDLWSNEPFCLHNLCVLTLRVPGRYTSREFVTAAGTV